ncbi:adhesion G-protein coupled receptor G5 isoform X2 [Varanus komodoensis]|uniref:adhesion G-protein coupled receptor G5 isoform X2 n=1 Tax=Varanus komodoensis TaxID=61221 RepID=UPI001CF7DA55|nr:adhesion G-protein coupled receptor G5 isoform X2 [Varanus komodoensis]
MNAEMETGLLLGLLMCAAALVQVSGSEPSQEADEDFIEQAVSAFESRLKDCNSSREELMQNQRRLEETLQEAAVQSKRSTFVHDHIQVLIFQVNPQDFPGLRVSSDNLMQFNSSVKIRTRHSMYFPTALTDVARDKHVTGMQLTCIYLKAPCLFQDGKNSSLLNDDVLGATLGNTHVANLSQPVEIQFWHNHSLASLNMTCVFWLEGTEKGDWGSWRSDGCRTNTSREGIVLCQCNHLTYFAVLLQFSPAPVDASLLPPLMYITDIGCGISASACLLTILFYTFSRESQPSSTTKIHMHLVGALFFLNLSFLLSKFLARVSPPWLCAGAAIFLHYSLLACLTWMALEGFHLYVLMIKVYNSYIRRYLLKLCSFGWGLPGLAVMAFSLIKSSIYGPYCVNTSSADHERAICWIVSSTVRYINLAYFSAAILFNMAVLCVVVRRVRLLKTSLPHRQKAFSCKDLVTVLGLTCLLGATWTLAFISFGKLTIVQIYLFTIFNSLQGFFIFVWYCYLRCHSQGDSLRGTSSRLSQ